MRVKWYRKAAEQGHAGAQLYLGVFLAQGQGVEPDFVEAYKWIELAKRGNEADKAAADESQKQLVAYMTPDQIAEGKRLARDKAGIHIEIERIKTPILSKKQISKEKMGQALWQLCCDSAEEFCIYFRPKFQELGFLSTPIEDTAFMNEVMMLHLWIISSVLSSEDSEVLDILHNNFRSFHPIAYNPTAAGNIRERYEHYHEAQLLDMKLDTKEIPSYMLPWAALHCLLNGGKPFQENLNLKLVTETNRLIYLTSGRVRKMRGEFEICKI
jgi:hypothetical protein